MLGNVKSKLDMRTAPQGESGRKDGTLFKKKLEKN